MIDPASLDAVAREARRQAAELKIASLKGKQAALASISSLISQQATDTFNAVSTATAERDALAEQIGDGITSAFDALSATDQALRAERYAGKAAWVDFVKANPTCAEADALAAYTAAAHAARPASRPWLLHDPAGLRREYASNLVAAGKILDGTWESLRGWVLATPRDAILGL